MSCCSLPLTPRPNFSGLACTTLLQISPSEAAVSPSNITPRRAPCQFHSATYEQATAYPTLSAFAQGRYTSRLPICQDAPGMTHSPALTHPIGVQWEGGKNEAPHQAV